jgi:hypothetical protein
LPEGKRPARTLDWELAWAVRAEHVSLAASRQIRLDAARMQIHGLHRRFSYRILSRMNRIQSEPRRRRSPLP